MQPPPILEIDGQERPAWPPKQLACQKRRQYPSQMKDMKRQFCMTEQDYLLCNPAKMLKGNMSSPFWLARFPPHIMHSTSKWKWWFWHCCSSGQESYNLCSCGMLICSVDFSSAEYQHICFCCEAWWVTKPQLRGWHSNPCEIQQP